MCCDLRLTSLLQLEPQISGHRAARIQSVAIYGFHRGKGYSNKATAAKVVSVLCQTTQHLSKLLLNCPQISTIQQHELPYLQRLVVLVLQADIPKRKCKTSFRHFQRLQVPRTSHHTWFFRLISACQSDYSIFAATDPLVRTPNRTPQKLSSVTNDQRSGRAV